MTDPDADAADAVLVMGLDEDGEAAWEFSIVQLDVRHDMGRHTVRYVKVVITHDAFRAFAQAPELFGALAEKEPVRMKEVRDILQALGATEVSR